MLGGVHLKAAPVVRSKPTAERAEQQPPVGVLSNGHDRQIGQTVLEAKRIEPGAVATRAQRLYHSYSSFRRLGCPGL